MNIRLSERDLQTSFGTFKEILYYDGAQESIALVMGEVSGGEHILCRVHSACIGGHVFNSAECTCREEMAAAQKAIQETGRGVIVYLDQEGRGNGHLALMLSIPFKNQGMSQSDAYLKAGFSADSRSYRAAAEILADLGVGSVVVLTDNTKKAEALGNELITVSGIRKLAV